MVFLNSRYVTDPLITARNTKMLNPFVQKHKFNLDDAKFYTFVQGDTIEGIAYRLYGNAQLWWAIMEVNPKYQAEMEIQPGDSLLIPPYSEVTKYCG